jgi:TRAP-type mannitol/chloroaromatic compound transport system permease small subunit
MSGPVATASPSSGGGESWAPLRLAAAIDALTRALGRAVSWLTVATVLIAAANAIARYFGRFVGLSLSSNLWLELQWYLFSLVFLLATAWAVERDVHVRVDVFSSRCSPRVRAWVDLGGHLLLLFPFTGFLIWACMPSVLASWRVREGSPDPGGLPRWPLKAMVLVALALLLLQGVSQVIKDVARLRGRMPAAPPPAPALEGT